MLQPLGAKLEHLIQLVFLLGLCVDLHRSLIITSVIAGDKKFKTISFDSKFLKPLTFEKELPTTEFRRHRTIRPPKFDIDVNIPIKLPLEEEYPQEEYKKPVESNIFFQTGEIHEPPSGGYPKTGTTKKKKTTTGGRAKTNTYTDDQYAAASEVKQQPTSMLEQGLKLLPTLAKSIRFEPQIVSAQDRLAAPNKRSDMIVQRQPPLGAKQPQQLAIAGQQQQQHQQTMMMTQESANREYQAPQASGYSGANDYNKQQEFIPGGFVNLQLSGPTGGPKMTYEDYDRERWAQQLSQTASAMPYPILNYHQLQNFYGGLGTFTNGLANQPYVEHSLLDKLKSGLTHFTDKLHIG